MSRLRHPQDGILLQHLDGELSWRQSRKVRTHLEACWQCRSELAELQTTIADCVRYRRQVLVGGLPQPPMAWGSLDFARVEGELAAESVWARLGRFFGAGRSAPLRWAASGVLVLAFTFAIVRQLRDTPNVEAAVL